MGRPLLVWKVHLTGQAEGGRSVLKRRGKSGLLRVSVMGNTHPVYMINVYAEDKSHRDESLASLMPRGETR